MDKFGMSCVSSSVLSNSMSMFDLEKSGDTSKEKIKHKKNIGRLAYKYVHLEVV
jgi:hypothetical protein